LHLLIIIKKFITGNAQLIGSSMQRLELSF